MTQNLALKAMPTQRVAILNAHRRAEEAGLAGYVDPSSGLFVLTSTYLRERGRCCGNGCRHCPHGHGIASPPPGNALGQGGWA